MRTALFININLKICGAKFVFTKCFTKICYNLVKGFCCYTTSQQAPNTTSLWKDESKQLSENLALLLQMTTEFCIQTIKTSNPIKCWQSEIWIPDMLSVRLDQNSLNFSQILSYNPVWILLYIPCTFYFLNAMSNEP